MISIALIILTQEEKKGLISVSDTVKPRGEYACNGNFESSDILQTCYSGAESCIFTVNNLNEAFNNCNINYEKCTRFMYNEENKTISYLNNLPSFSISTTSAVFIRNGNIKTA